MVVLETNISFEWGGLEPNQDDGRSGGSVVTDLWVLALFAHAVGRSQLKDSRNAYQKHLPQEREQRRSKWQIGPKSLFVQ